MVLEKTLESALDCKEVQPVHPKGDPSWVFIRRTDAEAETPILRTPHAKSWLIWKVPDAGKDWRQEEKRMTDGWMASPTQWAWVWVNSGQGSLACCDSWGRKESDTTERLNWTELNWTLTLPASLTQWVWIWANSGRWWRMGSLVSCSPWGHKESDTYLSDWTNQLPSCNMGGGNRQITPVKNNQITQPVSPDNAIHSQLESTVQRNGSSWERDGTRGALPQSTPPGVFCKVSNSMKNRREKLYSCVTLQDQHVHKANALWGQRLLMHSHCLVWSPYLMAFSWKLFYVHYGHDVLSCIVDGLRTIANIFFLAFSMCQALF